VCKYNRDANIATINTRKSKSKHMKCVSDEGFNINS